MSTIRYFGGARDSGKKSIAGSLARLEFDKKGKFTTAQRYSYIFKKRMKQKRQEASDKLAARSGREMSERARKALKEIAMRKAAKEAKKERKMVLVQPRTFANGKLERDGKLFDSAGNLVAKVNTKNGKIHLMSGALLGRYKPKSFMMDRMLQEAIDKHSPHFINLRKQQALAGQNYGVHGPAGGGNTFIHSPSEGSANIWGNKGGGIWGTSDSVWDDFAERVAAFFGLK